MSTTRTFGGGPVAFRKLTMGDLCRLSAVLHERNKSMLATRLASLYKASGIEEDKLPIVVAELSREPSLGETWRWLYTPEGIRQAGAVIAGVAVAEVDAWDDPLGLAEAVQVALGDRPERGDGSLPLSPGSGEAAAT